MKYTFKSYRNEDFEKQMKNIIKNSANSNLRSLFTKLHYQKENAEETCNHEMALSALDIQMVYCSKYRL
jgi:hypothetical protein